jgi:hypothetical protein
VNPTTAALYAADRVFIGYDRESLYIAFGAGISADHVKEMARM